MMVRDYVASDGMMEITKMLFGVSDSLVAV
jgi:hypothetical protein